MKNAFRLAFAYLKYYKKQTLTLFLGIVFSAALLIGIGSLMGSGRQAALEKARKTDGDWHYYMRCDYPWYKEFQKHMTGRGYNVEKAGVLTIRKALETPFDIIMASADSGYLDIMGRKIEKGSFPSKRNEVALDTFTLRNLEIPAVLGSKVPLGDEEFTLCGILTDMPDSDDMIAFVSEELDYGKNGKFLYLKFDESRTVYRQVEKMVKAFDIKISSVRRNNETVKYLGGEANVQVWETIKSGFTMKGAGLPYVWGTLNSSWNLTEKAILATIALFGIFIIYSLFQISVIRRMSQYSVMQTVGMSEHSTFGVLAAELCMIFLVGYPIGCLVGNGAAAFVYNRIGKIFVPMGDGRFHTGMDSSQELAAWNVPDPGGFYASKSVMFGGAVFFLVLIFFITWILIRRMRKLTMRELLAKDTGKKRKDRNVHSLKSAHLTGILTKRFMFERKGAFLGILLSLSVGSLIFLGTAFVTKNTQINNELTFKADDGLGSDIQVYEDSDVLSDVISENTMKKLTSIPELSSVSPVRYMLGEIPFYDGQFKWIPFYPEIANREGYEQSPMIMEKYNGIAVQTGEDDYLLKVNIYGYDDIMLENLNQYLLKGEIKPDEMRRDNTVIFKTLMDGQGNYFGIDIEPGGSVELKTPVNVDVPAEVLRFKAEDNQYKQTEFKVTALVSRPLGKVDTFIGDNGTDTVGIIMTNEQMQKNFGVSGYQTISISLKEGADAVSVADAVRKATSGINKCVVKDYSKQIEAQNLYLKQKMMFLYGVAVILLLISLLHIVNSMQYLVVARKQEFGILRAMGITDTGFRKMLAKEGVRYGIYSSAVMVVLFLIEQKILYYFMVHVFLYLHPDTSLQVWPVILMVVINIGICVGAVLVSGESVLKQQIIEEIRE